jgi:hypothetical protein
LSIVLNFRLNKILFEKCNQRFRYLFVPQPTLISIQTCNHGMTQRWETETGTMKHIAQPQMHLMKLDSVVPNYHASEGNNKERKEKAELLNDPTRAFLQQSSSSVFRAHTMRSQHVFCSRENKKAPFLLPQQQFMKKLLFPVLQVNLLGW